MNDLDLITQLRKEYDLDNEDLYMIATGQDTLEQILARRDHADPHQGEQK